MNVLCVAVLYKILLQEDCDFFDVRLGGRTSHPLYFYNHPCQKIPANLDNFYLFKLAYHFYELGHTLVLDRKRVDFVEYALHHFLTFSLILFSYSVGYLPIGAAVMILHDVTDLGCSVFKLTIDITPTAVEVIGYIGMVVPWLYVRLWFFPAHVISRIFEEMNSWHGVRINRHMMIMLTVFLIVLFCMHIFWFYLMVKGLLRRFQAKTWKSGISFATNANNVE
ncbi:hypothetical protein FGO68_gene12725 [Halteria grandinella]|uniref:TLC domain-containing protein n=1 Tax=Halteria grandinella TaxID=5974 RepID=A0A8J8NXU5_HALGN|nr:hypothetical protein FGO68_gene12725 [Halteria grandinella]